MIREYRQEDKEALEEYAGGDIYGEAVLRAVEAFGTDQDFQTVYVDIDAEGGKDLKGVYVWLYRNLILYAKENQVDIDFLEQMAGAVPPEKVTGRKDNINIVSWLLTDYHMEMCSAFPELSDENGGRIEGLSGGGEWAVLSRIV